MSRYQIILKTPTGLEVQRYTQVNSLVCGRSDRAVMPCEVIIPMTKAVTDFSKDMLMEVWRDNNDGSITLDGETAYFLRKWEFYRDYQGKDVIYLKGYDGNYILTGREVEYDAGGTATSKTGVACDVIKEIIDENFVNATDTTRNLSSSYFKIAGDDGFGGTVTKAFSRQYVLPLIQNLAEQSRNSGTWVTFDTVYDGSLPFEFRTYVNQRGDDLTDSVVLEVEAGNLAEPVLTFDYSDEITVAYVAGRGQESDRLVGTATNTDALNESVWSRREFITENFQVTTEAGLNSEARSILEKNKGKITLDGSIVSSKGNQYGRDWNYGDKVRAKYLGYEFYCRILGYEINYSVSNDGIVKDEIKAKIRGELDG
jgi:hypothetical protein